MSAVAAATARASTEGADLALGPATFPGATLLIDADGMVIAASAGWNSPIELGQVVGQPAYAVLGLSPEAGEAGAMQLLLAMACGNDAAGFAIAADAAPTRLPAAGARAALALEVAPYPAVGPVEAVWLFVTSAGAWVAPSAAPEPVIDPEELTRFAVDSGALLDAYHGALCILFDDPQARPPLHRMFRALHTLKANARGLGQLALGDLAHDSEELLDRLRTSAEPVAEEALADLQARLGRLRALVGLCARRDGQRDMMQAFDHLARFLLEGVPDRATLAMVAQHHGLFALAEHVGGLDETGWQAQAEATLSVYRALHAELRVTDDGPAWLAELTAGPPVLAPPGSTSRIPLLRASAGVNRLRALAAGASGAGLREVLALVDDPQPLLAALRDLAAMFAPCPNDDVVDEDELARREVQRALAVLVATGAGSAGLPPAVAAAIDAVAVAIGRMGWVPTADLGRRVERLARTVAAELGKEVEVTLQLGMARVPAPVHRALADILVHAVRNALDHGLEDGPARARAGKPAAGRLTISLADADGGVVCEVRDDGAGIDRERVLARACARGLIDAEAAATLGDDAVFEILFHPGFSTASTVTTVSGRGVGMDVIRALAEDLCGSAGLRSSLGHGTTLHVWLPLHGG